MHQLVLLDYTEDFLSLSWEWLNDPEIKQLTMTPDFTQEGQMQWFQNLKNKKDYLIWGLEIDGVKAGVCGIKNIKDKTGEYWGYIGIKEYWGKGIGKQILHEVSKKALLNNLTSLYLKVSVSNLRAINAYKSFGFLITGNDADVYLMEKTL